MRRGTRVGVRVRGMIRVSVSVRVRDMIRVISVSARVGTCANQETTSAWRTRPRYLGLGVRVRVGVSVLREPQGHVGLEDAAIRRSSKQLQYNHKTMRLQ